MKKHLNILGTIYIAYGLIGILITIISIFLAARDIHRLENGMNVTEWQPISLLVVSLIFLVGLISVFYLTFGRALKKESKWATRVVGIITGVILLFQFPFGTIIGGYTLWVLIKLDQSTLKKTEPAVGAYGENAG